MPDFQLSYSGEQVNMAIGNGLNAVTTESGQTLTPEQQQVVQEKIGLEQLFSHTAPPIVEDKSGSMVSITDASNQTAVSLVSQIVPVQAGSGDPSPVNVRRISGWNELEAVRTGSNLAGTVVPIGIISNNQIQCNSNWRSLEIPVVQGIYYTVSRASVNTNVRFRYCFTEAKASVVEGATTSCFDMHSVDSSISFTVQAPENASYLYVYVDNSGASIDLSQYTVNVGQQAAAYEPYDSETLTAELPEMVYGGNNNWTIGMLTVEKGKHILDGVNGVVSKVSVNGSGVYYASAGLPTPGVKTGSVLDSLLSDKLIAKNKVEPGCCYITGSNADVLVIALPDQSLTTVDAINAWLVDNPITFVYDLATPYEIQLTPQQIALLKGTNNVWSNSGDTTISYVADTKMYIDGLVSSIASAVLNN